MTFNPDHFKQGQEVRIRFFRVRVSRRCYLVKIKMNCLKACFVDDCTGKFRITFEYYIDLR